MNSSVDIPGGVALLQVTMKGSRTCGSITSRDFQCYSSRETSKSIRDFFFFFFIEQLVSDTYDCCQHYTG